MKSAMPEASAPFTQVSLDKSSDVLRALAHPLRIRLINYIEMRGSAAVQSIYQDLDIEQSLTSQHLRILRRAGLVATEREGKFVVYRVVEERLGRVTQAVRHFLGTGPVIEA